jgi:hypothetical protein
MAKSKKWMKAAPKKTNGKAAAAEMKAMEKGAGKPRAEKWYGKDAANG